MKEKKNIDRLYQEKFKDFEVTPQPRVWDGIARELKKDQERKVVVLPLWYKLAGVAAVFALLLGGFWWLNNLGSGNTPGVVFETEDFERPQINIPGENTTLQKTRAVLKQIATENSSDNEGNSNQREKKENGNTTLAEIDDSGKNDQPSTTKISARENTILAETSAKNSPEEKENRQKENLHTILTDTTSIIAEKADENKYGTEKDSLKENAIANLDQTSREFNEEKEEKEIAATNKNRLSLKTFAAPVVYNNLGSGNALDPQFAGNSSNSNLTMAYGMNLAYQVSEKIKIRSGISKVAMSYDIEDVRFSAAIMPNAIQSINYSGNSNNIQIQGNSTRESFSDISTSFAPQNAARPMLGKINQQFGFIEVPVEIEYSLIDKTIGLNLIGGGSSLFLDENSILLSSNNQNTRLGEANNINNFSFSTNIGLGVNYKLSESFNFNLEPIFKYQLNTFTGTRDVQPYYFGVYTGFSYKF